MLALLLALTVSTARTVRVTVAPAETLTVEVRGVGAPVILLPGLFGGTYAYRQVANRLVARGYRVVAIEPLALGSSSRPASADYSLAAQAARVAAVMDTLQVEGAIVVGHSAGAAIAYRLALARPDLVRALVSLEGGPAESAATPGFRRAMSLAPMLRLAGRGFFRGRIRSGLIASSGDAAWVTDELIAAYTAGATADLGATLRAFVRMAESREPERLAPRLGALRCPITLVLGGAPHDGGPPADEVALMRSLVAGLQVVTVDGAGHYLQEERPDAVVDAVARFSDVRVEVRVAVEP